MRITSSGLICAPLTASLALDLSLPQMVTSNTDPNRTAYTVSIDANHESTTTGISASDRALTCRTLASCAISGATDPYQTSPTDQIFRRPGHIFPLQARNNGVLERPGHTEAAVDFCKLTGKAPVGVICELVDDGKPAPEDSARRVEGGMLRSTGCLDFGRRWGLKVCTIAALQEYILSANHVRKNIG